MKSYKITSYDAPLECMEEPAPEPGAKEVLLRVTDCGVCHSDLHVWHGYFDLGGGKRIEMSRSHQLPITPGHEIAGVVEALGVDVEGWSAGDSAVVYPWIGCGECAVCGEGLEQLCANQRHLGIHTDGGYADRVLVPNARYLYGLGELPPALAATYACSGLTAYSALKKVSDRCSGKHLLIIGAGGVGMAALTIAPAVTDATLIVADIDDEKLARAREAGAHHVVKSGDKDARRELMKLTGGGFPAAIDFVGSPASAGFGISVLGSNSRLVVVGLFGGALELSLPFLPLKSMGLIGSLVGSPAELGELITLAKAGKIAPLPVETRPLDQANQALADLEAGKVNGRIVLTA